MSSSVAGQATLEADALGEVHPIGSCPLLAYASSGASLDAQIEQLRRIKNGLPSDLGIDFFVDGMASPRSASRPAFERLMKAIGDTGALAVVVTDLERLVPTTEELTIVLGHLQRHRVVLWSLAEAREIQQRMGFDLSADVVSRWQARTDENNVFMSSRVRLRLVQNPCNSRSSPEDFSSE